MKKVLKVFLIGVLLLTLVSCNKNNTPDVVIEGVNKIIKDYTLDNVYYTYTKIDNYLGKTFENSEEVYIVDLHGKVFYHIDHNWYEYKFIITLENTGFVQYEEIK